MPSLDALGSAFTLARQARTVRPSATVPALGFLAGLRSVRPVAWELGRAGIPTDVVTGELSPTSLPVAWSLATTAGVRRLVSKGAQARDTAAAVHRMLAQPEDRLLFVYL